jgi:hypothetical protein
MQQEEQHDEMPPARSYCSEGFRVRKYQHEMLDRSLNGNVIIAVGRLGDDSLLDANI